MVSLFPSNKRPLAARSVMSAIFGLAWESKWSRREREGGLGDRVVCNVGWRRIGGLRVELHLSRGGRSLTKYSSFFWLRHRRRSLE